MGRLLLQINMSLDGFVADSEGKLDWMIPETDQRQIEFLKKLSDRVGVIILGRKMATESIPHWQKVAASSEQNEEVKFAKFFTKTEKVIFSKTFEDLCGRKYES